MSARDCERCRGTGSRMWPHTGMWRTGGVYGQAMTEGPCDHCWGSGDEARHWPSHKRIAELEREQPCGHPATAIGKVREDDPKEEPHCLWCGDIEDLGTLSERLSLTFEHFSGLSKPMTHLEHIFKLAAEREEERTQEAIKEATEELERELAEAKEKQSECVAALDGAGVDGPGVAGGILHLIEQRDALQAQVEKECKAKRAYMVDIGRLQMLTTGKQNVVLDELGKAQAQVEALRGLLGQAVLADSDHTFLHTMTGDELRLMVGSKQYEDDVKLGAEAIRQALIKAAAGEVQP